MAIDDSEFDDEYRKQLLEGHADLRRQLADLEAEIGKLKGAPKRTQPGKIATSVRLDPDVHELWKSTGQTLEEVIRNGALAHLAFQGSLPPAAVPAQAEVLIRDEDGRVYKGTAVLKRA